MTTNYISRKVKVFNSKIFRDSFKESTPRKVGYIFLSKSSPYPNENVATDLVDTVKQEKEIWDNMVLGKRIVPKDVELVIPLHTWARNTVYKQYDDTINLDSLLTVTNRTDNNGQFGDFSNVYPMYVRNSEGNVYKCLSNTSTTGSLIEPTGTYTQNDGFIQTELDDTTNYLWKYMYNVKDSNKFYTNEYTDRWIPVPFIQANTNFSDYNYNTSNLIEGSLNKIIVTNSGSGYYHTNINVAPFAAGSNTLTILDDIDLTTSNTIEVNMAVSGNGIYANRTYITSINSLQPKVLYLSEPTVGSGGGTSTPNRISIKTRVVIDGDGSNTITNVILSNTGISRIDVTNAGVGYVKANVIIYGSGSSATARAILPPKFGHGYNPAMELGASNVMILSRIGEVDASENDTIPTDVYFRQYGLLVNPYKYNDTDAVTETNALDVILQTLDVTLLSFSNFTVNERVYQGNTSNPDFVGYVVTQEDNIVRLNNTYKQPIAGKLLVGTSSGNQSTIVSYENPDLKPYAGDIIYGKNILKIQRSVAQAEEVKFVFQF
jgi:hypothetical protein